jgi:hypothetical protein
MRWTGHTANMREMRNPYKILVRSLEGRPRYGWEDNIKIYLEESDVRM